MEVINTPLLAPFLFITGIVFGSFLNVLSDRLPAERSILGRSNCESCKHVLAWYDLIPILSYFFLKARCRYCKAELSLYYPLVEIVTGTVFVMVWFLLPIDQLHTISNLSQSLIISLKILYEIIAAALLVVFFADLKSQIIPDSMQTVLFISAQIIRMIVFGFGVDVVLYSLVEGFIIMSPLLLLYVLTKGRGMGFGDVKLAFIIGVLFGVKIGIGVLYISFVFGALVGLILIISKKSGIKSKIAFGPFIVASMFVALFYHDIVLVCIKKLWGV